MLTESGLFRAESQLQNRIPGLEVFTALDGRFFFDQGTVLYYASDECFS